MRITHKERAKALEDFDPQILRAAAQHFARTADNATLCQWLAAFPRFHAVAQELRDTTNLTLQVARGCARSAKGDFLILDGGKSNESRRSIKARSE